MHPQPGIQPQPTANERLKQRSRSWLPRSLVLAVLIHVAVLTLASEFTVADTQTEHAPDLLVIPPARELPPPPEPITRPAEPVVGDLHVELDVTIPSTRIEDWAPEKIAPPRRTPDRARQEFEWFAPTMVAPVLQNAAEVERELVRRYPPVLRDAGIGGQVDVQLWLDENGRIVRSSIARTSGIEALDAAALKVVHVMRLSPALSLNRPVRVIVTLPVLFNVR